MKKATLIIWAIIFGVIALLIFQNQDFFMATKALRINLGILEEYHTPEMPAAILFLLFFLIGVLIAYLFSLSARFKARRMIKKLNASNASLKSDNEELRRENNSLKGIETPVEDPTPETGDDTATTHKLATDDIADGTAEQTGTFSIGKKDDNPAETKEETTEEKQ
jgi:uncharacterized integral membrane protein